MREWICLIFGFVVLTAIFYAFSFLIDDEIDWRILLLLNPNSPIPVVDDLMILITDFSMPLFVLVFLFWEIGYQASKRARIAKKNVENSLKIIGIIFSTIITSAYFWAGYEHRSIFFPLAIIFAGAFWLMGSTIGRYKEEKLRQVNRLFWITILAALLTELASEEIIKDAVMRPRPLSDAYAVYNKEIRTVADEIVRGGNSYVAGHSAAFFAMITPMIYFASKRWLKAGLLLWALVHAFTRVYLAAHFPYCSLMGALFGFSMATLVVKIFGVSENGREPFVKDYTRNLLSPILHAIFGVEFKSE